MIYTFDVKKPIEDITKKLGIDAQGTLKKVIYDKMRESVTFVVEKFKGDAELLKHQLTEFLGVHADVLIEERAVDLANPDSLKEYTMDLTSIVTGALVAVPAVIGGASLIVQGIAKITKITPSIKDDEIVGKVEAFLAGAQRIFDKLALNLPADKARRQ